MSARWRLAATGLTPEKPGLPRRMSIVTAAEVSSCAPVHVVRVGEGPQCQAALLALLGGRAVGQQLQHPGQLQGVTWIFQTVHSYTKLLDRWSHSILAVQGPPYTFYCLIKASG